MRTDPTDTGGLFVGRRPGTGPVRYRALPPPGSKARRRVDATIAFALLATMFVIAASFWGPIPLAGLWIGSQFQYYANSPAGGILVAFLFILGVMLLGLVVLKKLDRWWILVRRAAGHDQREGVLGKIFALTCGVGVSGFTIWLLLFSGASLAPTGLRF